MAGKIHSLTDSDFEDRRLNESNRRVDLVRQPNTGTAIVPGSGVFGTQLTFRVERFRKNDEG